MPFKRILEELVTAVPNAEGAILTDWEGEAVEHYAVGDPFRLKVVGAHKGIILTRLKEVHADSSLAGVAEVLLRAAESQILVATIGADYAVVMVLHPDALPGQAMFHLRRTVRVLEKEIC